VTQKPTSLANRRMVRGQRQNLSSVCRRKNVCPSCHAAHNGRDPSRFLNSAECGPWL